MNAGEELISIIVPVYNAGNYIEETIHMVEKQTYRTWELILVDDHSADDSRKIIENYLDRREKEQRDKDSEAGEIRLITKDENEGVEFSLPANTKTLQSYRRSLVKSKVYQGGQQFAPWSNCDHTGAILKAYKTFDTSAAGEYIEGSEEELQ